MLAVTISVSPVVVFSIICLGLAGAVVKLYLNQRGLRTELSEAMKSAMKRNGVVDRLVEGRISDLEDERETLQNDLTCVNERINSTNERIRSSIRSLGCEISDLRVDPKLKTPEISDSQPVGAYQHGEWYRIEHNGTYLGNFQFDDDNIEMQRTITSGPNFIICSEGEVDFFDGRESNRDMDIYPLSELTITDGSSPSDAVPLPVSDTRTVFSSDR